MKPKEPQRSVKIRIVIFDFNYFGMLETGLVNMAMLNFHS